jgi:O-antigen ligase
MFLSDEAKVLEPKGTSTFAQRLLLFLFALLTCCISLEYKYHKLFRHTAERISSTLDIPAGFEKKFILYPSDLLTLFLLGMALAMARHRLKDSALRRESLLACSLPFFALLSVAFSPLWNYPISYFHVWQYGTAAFLFIALSLVQEPKRVLRVILLTLAVVGTFQAAIAIAQYFTQESVGLRWLGEPTFSRSNLGISSQITVPSGNLWLFDRFWGRTELNPLVIRAMGTLCHANILGGFLMMTSLVTLSQFAYEKGRLFMGICFCLQFGGLVLTFSRSALFGFSIALTLWLLLSRASRREVLLLVIGSITIAGTLFHEQILNRGGLVNYNEMVKSSDAIRLESQKQAILLISKKPLLGVGHEQFMYRVAEFLPEGSDPGVIHLVHNMFLMLASETGLISLFCFLSLIGSVFWVGLKKRNEPYALPLTGILLGFLFIGMCDFYLFTFQTGRLMLFLIAGLIASHRPIQERYVEQTA